MAKRPGDRIQTCQSLLKQETTEGFPKTVYVSPFNSRLHVIIGQLMDYEIGVESKRYLSPIFFQVSKDSESSLNPCRSTLGKCFHLWEFCHCNITGKSGQQGTMCPTKTYSFLHFPTCDHAINKAGGKTISTTDSVNNVLTSQMGLTTCLPSYQSTDPH